MFGALNRRNHSYILYLSLMIGWSWLVSALTLTCLGLSNMPYPWSVLTVVSHGIYWEPIVSAIVLALPLALIPPWVQGGFKRVLTSYILAVLFGVLVSVGLGFLIYACLEGIPDLNFDDIITLLYSIHQDSLQRDHFMYGQLGSFGVVSLIAAWIVFDKVRPANKVLGDAHFASGLEVQRAGFFVTAPESIIIGKKYGVPLYANGFEHVLVFAPAGSGKTRSIAIPNLFNYPYSIVCNDVKLTLFETTSKYRERVLGHACYCFAPAHVGSVTHRYNPLTFISNDRLMRIADIQRIGQIFIPENDKNPIWHQTSRDLFKALTLYLLDTPERPTTMGEINRLVKQSNFDGWLKQTLDNTTHYDPEFYRNGYAYINTEQETRSNMLVSFSSHFGLFDDPMIDAATSASDFDFGDLRRKKITIYVGFTDEDMHRLSPLLTLFWQQLLSRMIQAIPDKVDEPYPLLCLVDEFSSLGRIESLRRSLKLFREYRVRCVLMFQYIAQTYEKYSHDEARAFVNIKTKVAYTTEDIQDAEFISKMLGTRTQRVVAHSVSNQSHGASHSKNTSYQAIPLLRPDEIMKLSPKLSLIIRSGSAPIKAGQYIWYKERVMRRLAQGQSSVPTQSPKQVPFEHVLIMDEKTRGKAEQGDRHLHQDNSALISTSFIDELETSDKSFAWSEED